MPPFFTKNLLQWYYNHKRDLPWRKTDDPYKIWISEIMLQQTRVDTVIPYFLQFTAAFPTVKHLAEAPRRQVLKLWEGLGYYSRARNLHDAAKTIVQEFDEKIPDSWETITSIKGIGPYTASAILSIAFNKPCAVVDGNVMRVITRFYGMTGDIRLSGTKHAVQQSMDQLLPEATPGDFNQAVMELGAIICKPTSPNCTSCPVSGECIAYQTVQTETIPWKSPAPKIPHHQIAVGLILNRHGNLLIALRPENAMLGGLWEFPGGKQEQGEALPETVEREMKEELGIKVRVYGKFHQLKHAYSHFRITLHAFWCEIEEGSPVPKSSTELKWVSLDEIEQFPFPKANKTLIDLLKKMESEDLTRFLAR